MIKALTVGRMRIAPDRAIPTHMKATITDPGLPWVVEIEIVVTPLRGPEAKWIRLERRADNDGHPITTQSLRQVHPTALIKRAVMASAKPIRTLPDGHFQVIGESRSHAHGGPTLDTRPRRRKPVGGRGRRVPDETLRRVAALYKAALANGENPTKAVYLRLPCPRSTAGRYVAQARDRGFLGPAIDRKAGEQEQS